MWLASPKFVSLWNLHLETKSGQNQNQGQKQNQGGSEAIYHLSATRTPLQRVWITLPPAQLPSDASFLIAQLVLSLPRDPMGPKFGLNNYWQQQSQEENHGEENFRKGSPRGIHEILHHTGRTWSKVQISKGSASKSCKDLAVAPHLHYCNLYLCQRYTWQVDATSMDVCLLVLQSSWWAWLVLGGSKEAITWHSVHGKHTGRHIAKECSK